MAFVVYQYFWETFVIGVRWHSVAFVGVQWCLLACSGVCWRSEAFVGVQWRLLAFSGVRWRAGAFVVYQYFWETFVIGVCWRSVAFVGVQWRLLCLFITETLSGILRDFSIFLIHVLSFSFFHSVALKDQQNYDMYHN